VTSLLLKRAATSRPSGEWNEDDYDVVADGTVVGRIFKANASPVGASWMWTLDFWHHEDRTPTHGYAATREPNMSESRISPHPCCRRPLSLQANRWCAPVGSVDVDRIVPRATATLRRARLLWQHWP
jgi:hypothetical protein